MEAKVKYLERWREIKERKRRRRNVVKSVEIGGGVKEAVRKIWEEMQVSAKIVEVKEIGRENGKEEGGRCI